MAPSFTQRLPIRNRAAGIARAKGDENAMSKHLRQGSGAGVGPSRSSTFGKNIRERPVLNEVTKTTVNRKEQPFKATGKEKESVDILKRRSVPTTTTTTVAPQRAQPAPRPVSSQSIQSIPSRPSSIRVAPSVSQIVNLAPPVVEDEDEQSMDIEEVVHEDPRELMNAIREVETMIDGEYRPYDDHTEYIWPEVSPERAERYRREVQAIRDVFVDEPDMHDTTMVSEYAEEIFQYMSDLEETLIPNPEYMDGQNDLTWEMRQTLVDWLLQVHLRYHMLPETIWIAINIIDRFLTKRVVSIAKLQLVGITAIFIAAKYEEILAPGVDEFVFLTQNAYSREEIHTVG